MKAYDIVKKKLENFPDFRERKLRSKYLAVLALRELGLEDKFDSDIPLRIEEMADFAITFDTYRHAWTDVTKDHEDLRGTDWEEKTALEQNKQIELGYEPGFHEDIKRLNMLSTDDLSDAV